VFLFRGRWRLDDYQARKLRREIEDQDEARNRARIEQDLARADSLRKELAELTTRNNAQFGEIIDLRQDLMDVRQELFELRQWANQAANLAAGGPVALPPVPSMRVQPRRYRPVDSETA
jgi:hypothetical protein